MGWDGAKFKHLGLRVPVLAVLLLGTCQAHPIPDSSPLLQFGGQVRQRYLYTDDAQETEAHLEIRADGTVVGAARQSPESEYVFGEIGLDPEAVGNWGLDSWVWGKEQRPPEPLTTFSPQVSWS